MCWYLLKLISFNAVVNYINYVNENNFEEHDINYLDKLLPVIMLFADISVLISYIILLNYYKGLNIYNIR